MKEARRDSYNRGRMDNDMEVSMEMLQGTDMEGVWLEKLDNHILLRLLRNHTMVVIFLYVGENVETKMQTFTIFPGTALLLRDIGEEYILPYKLSLNV